MPTIGEMFSGNDLDLGESKNFVNANFIENPDVAVSQWMMNPHSSTLVRVVRSDGYVIYGNQSEEGSIRPVIFLKNNLTFTGGNGTAQSSYELQ